MFPGNRRKRRILGNRVVNRTDVPQNGGQMLSKIDSELYNLDRAICRHIENIGRDSRGEVSQDVLSDLRHYVEHVMFKIYDNDRNLEITYENICRAEQHVSGLGKYKWLKNFHDGLQIVVSHYKPTEENAERLMLKYYESLFKIREEMNTKYGLNLLHNLERFPLNTDPELVEYYQKIASIVDGYETVDAELADRYYIHKIKPFFVNRKVYYEVTFSSIYHYGNKTDRFIAFTKIPIDTNYASKLRIVNTTIEIMGHEMPVLLIVGWEISIRNCEFKNFIQLIDGEKREVSYRERIAICSWMMKHERNLSELMTVQEAEYRAFKKSVRQKTKRLTFLPVLDTCRKIIHENRAGKNILRYLLFTMNNTVIKNQSGKVKNINLSDLYLKNAVIPFDNMPFTFSPVKHNPPFHLLVECFDVREHDVEMPARKIINETECNGNLFTSLDELEEPVEKIREVVKKYNRKLWRGHRPDNELKMELKHIFIRKYVSDCRFIIDRLKELSMHGVTNYTESVTLWLEDKNNGVDSEEKKEVMKKMFADSEVAIVYGAAGTGKSTLINHVAHFFSDQRKLFLAQTNPAVDNLKRRVNASNSEFMTVRKFSVPNHAVKTYDILVIDECSTVSNSDMRRILEKATFKLLILVGDTYQIESIRFGNWFQVARHFVPETSVAELVKPYRSQNTMLQELWDSVRAMDENVLELLTRQNYSTGLDESVFQPSERDEIILCLNYDGLYGINNINRFLQESNPSECVNWEIRTFKAGDPILFFDIDRFGPAIYNNMKGRILKASVVSVGQADERIEFDIELDKVINGMDVVDGEFELLEHGTYEEARNSVIRFSVYKNKDSDADEIDPKCVIPFQVSYAVSIHKAQGLEYNSVKIVITDEIDEMITHNIFYTAITRAKSKLKIYWSPEVERKVLSKMKPGESDKVRYLLYQVDL